MNNLSTLKSEASQSDLKNLFEQLIESNRAYYLKKQPETIDREFYYQIMEALPPQNFNHENGIFQFHLSEFQTGTITAQFGCYDNVYLKKFIDVKDRSTWLKKSDFYWARTVKKIMEK